MAGEVGHMQLNYHALKLLGWDNAPIYECGCGNRACLDTYILVVALKCYLEIWLAKAYQQKKLSNVSIKRAENCRICG
ncbi:N-acetyl-D-glucosamine kinase [Actinobacillus equuli]|nr:N-acetyl-D-glucosamine kinase [Actinobacillus equuli]